MGRLIGSPGGERLRTVPDLEALKLWYEESLFLTDAGGAPNLADMIRNAPLF